MLPARILAKWPAKAEMGSSLTRLAGILPRQPEFRAWLAEAALQPITAEDAAEFIRIACGVDSRRESRAAEVNLR